jgi:glycosyltransferase involved in cell wall biosynthesis
MPDKTRILILNDQLTRGGKERRIVELVRYCQQRYTNVIFELVIIHSHVEYDEVYDTGYKVHLLYWAKNGALSSMKKIFRITKEFKPDIIHSWSSMTDVIALLLKAYTGKKFFTSTIARTLPRKTLLDKDYRRSLIVFHFANAITSNTEAGIDSYGAPRIKSTCIYNGFNFERINNLHRASEIIQQHQLDGKCVVGNVSGFFPRKDHETFIKAAISLIEKYPGRFVFILIGYGPLQEDRMKQAGKYFGKEIIFTGICNEVEEYVNVFDIGVLCTNGDVHGEGISNSIMEYMALGKPVVATEGGGTNEIVIDTITGFLAKNKNAADLEQKILYLADHPEEAKLMGAKGRARVERYFSIEAMCKSFMHIYHELCPDKHFKDRIDQKEPKRLALI